MAGIEMNRRSFFKVIGGLAAAAAIPTVLLEATKAVPAGVVELGLIREMSAYDIYEDLILLRYDVLAKDVQLHVDMRVTSAEFENKKSMAEPRRIAKELLEKEMKRRGIAWADLEPMPLPYGYSVPACLV